MACVPNRRNANGSPFDNIQQMPRSSLKCGRNAASSLPGVCATFPVIASLLGCTVALDLDTFSFQAYAGGAGGAASAASNPTWHDVGPLGSRDLRERIGPPRGPDSSGESVGVEELADASAISGSFGGAGGSEVSAPKDAGYDEPPANDVDACAPLALYRDNDGDELGDVSTSRMGCPSRGWVTEPGDCRDDLADVHPRQEVYSSLPYPDVTRLGGVSFDYDCSGGEEPDIGNLTLAPVPTCGGLLTCEGAGYLPAEPIRTGEGIDPRCGSNVLRSCQLQSVLGACFAVDDVIADSDRFRCK